MADLISMLAAASGIGAEEADPNFNQTVLLLHGDGTNGAQNNTFLDSSTNNFTITRNGNTTQGTFSPFSGPNGYWSNFFDGNADYLTTPSSTTLAVGSGDFTIECWIYMTARGSFGNYIVDFRTGNTLFLSTDALDRFQYYNGAFTESATGVIKLNQWQHICVVRSGAGTNNVKGYVDGVQVLQLTDTTNYGTANVVTIGSRYTGSDFFYGYMSNFRIVKGTAVYTSAFTPPTTPLTAIANTSLLTCQSNRFVDNSTNAFAITRNGDVRVTPFSPFAPTAAYSAGTNGGSGYFDGTGDGLSIANNAAFDVGTGDFTVEAWIYTNTVAAGQAMIAHRQESAVGGAVFQFRRNAAQIQLLLRATGGSIQTVSTSSFLTVGAWYHVAAVRASGVVTIYVNGATDGTGSANANPNCSQPFSVGFYDDGVLQDLYWNGYLSNVRLVKGTAVTPPSGGPTSPVTAISGTSLLCNFTNAGIFDNTGKNVLETVGNAQIDTTTKKYGTGSLEFDGTGDWLLMPNTPDQQLGTGNFTIEFWVYLATGDTGSARGLVAKGTSTTGLLVSLDSSQKVVFTFATSTITSSGAITLDAWNHIAVVRSGTGSNQTKIYIGGTNDGTGTVSTDFNQTSVMYVGANRTGGDPMKGFIDDLRITKGVARYTANFTPPTAAFPNE